MLHCAHHSKFTPESINTMIVYQSTPVMNHYATSYPPCTDEDTWRCKYVSKTHVCTCLCKQKTCVELMCITTVYWFWDKFTFWLHTKLMKSSVLLHCKGPCCNKVYQERTLPSHQVNIHTLSWECMRQGSRFQQTVINNLPNFDIIRNCLFLIHHQMRWQFASSGAITMFKCFRNICKDKHILIIIFY